MTNVVSDLDDQVVLRAQVDRGDWNGAEIRSRRKADLTQTPQ